MNRRGFLLSLIGAAAAPLVARVPSMSGAQIEPLADAASLTEIDALLAKFWNDFSLTPTEIWVTEESLAAIQKVLDEETPGHFNCRCVIDEEDFA